MDREHEKLLNNSHDARLVLLNEQIIYPLLLRKISEQVDKLCNEFEAGKPPAVNAIALMSACRALKQELEAVSRRGEAAVTKLHKKMELE